MKPRSSCSGSKSSVSCTERALRAWRRIGWAHGVAATLLTLACDSTALSLDDPNAVNATIEPPFIANDDTVVPVTVRFVEGESGSAGAASSSVTPLVLSADFGVDLASNNWMFEDDFVVHMDLTRYADTALGERPFTVRIFNRFGTFIARGRLTVY